MLVVRYALLVALAALATSVRAETINCTPVTSLPAVISTQGLYCLTGNLTTSQATGNAIEIDANNVTLDLNGWKVGGQAAGTGTVAIGIYSTAVNVTVKNGIVRGFRGGIYLTGRGAVVQDMLVDQNTVYGIRVDGQGAVVDRNKVVDTGGTTAYTGADATAIDALGESSTVSNDVVSGLTATDTGNEYGIYVTGVQSTVHDNVISDSAPPTGGGTSYGIFQEQSIVANNFISNFVYGIYNAYGIFAHNTANNCTTSYGGSGTAGAGNSP